MDTPIGQLIRTAQAGDAEAASILFGALYRELHSIAEREVRRGGADLTLGTTTLLHEAYLNIAHREGLGFASRGEYLAYAAMRGLTIDYVRRRRARALREVVLVDSLAELHSADLGEADLLEARALCGLRQADSARRYARAALGALTVGGGRASPLTAEAMALVDSLGR